MKKAHIYAIPAIGAALIAVLAQISIPIGPVPFTLQNFAIGLIATVSVSYTHLSFGHAHQDQSDKRHRSPSGVCNVLRHHML